MYSDAQEGVDVREIVGEAGREETQMARQRGKVLSDRNASGRRER